MNSQYVIGVFDSGIGGLWLLLELSKQMPGHDFIYFADSKYAPWGTLTKEVLVNRSEEIAHFLIEHGCENIVIACNTATLQCINHLRSKYTQRFFGIEPAVKPAKKVTKTGKIGLLATDGTLNSDRVKMLISHSDDHTSFDFRRFPNVVELLENGQSVSGVDTLSTIKNILEDFKSKNIDTIILGCTHYRYLYDEIRSQAGIDFTVVEPVYDVARYIKNELVTEDKMNPQCKDEVGKITIFTSGDNADIIKGYTSMLFPTRCLYIKSLF